jgi:DnaD/phage-associated family protein
MSEFTGFPYRMQFTPVPNIIFNSLLAQITDINELKVLLCLFKIIYSKKGKVRSVSFSELSTCLKFISGNDGHENLPDVFDSLIDKKVILRLSADNHEVNDNIYFLNSEADRLILEKIRNGEVVLPGIKPSRLVPVSCNEVPDIYTLYEQNIGMLTPLIADELREAEKNYPVVWIKDAIKEAVSRNNRSWKYISRILEHWSTKGKDDGTYRRNIKKNTDPDKYIRGRYGHMVQR